MERQQTSKQKSQEGITVIFVSSFFAHGSITPEPPAKANINLGGKG
jgi:hypothetical protein